MTTSITEEQALSVTHGGKRGWQSDLFQAVRFVIRASDQKTSATQKASLNRAG